jgi:hypothetical protein
MASRGSATFSSCPNGSGPWRVVDSMRADLAGAAENVLVVQLFGD